MKAPVFVSCDKAFFDENRKLCIIGIFNKIRLDGLPGRLIDSYLAINIIGKPNMVVSPKVELISPGDGKKTWSQTLPEMKLSNDGSAYIVFQILGLQFDKFGTYTFRLSVGEKKLNEFYLHAEKNEDVNSTQKQHS